MNEHFLCVSNHQISTALTKLRNFIVAGLFLFLMLTFSDSHAEAIQLFSTDQRYSVIDTIKENKIYTAPGDIELSRFLDMKKVEQQKLITHDQFPYEGGRYEFSFYVENQTEQTEWILHINNLMIDNINILIQTPGNNAKTASNIYSDKNIYQINPIGRSFKLSLPAHSKSQIFIQLDYQLFEWDPYIGIMSQETYQHWSENLTLIQALFLGIIIGIILYNFILLFFMRDKTYLWYTIAMGTTLFLYLIYSGILWELLDYRPDSYYQVLNLFALNNIFSLLFSYNLLNIHQWSNRWQVLYRGFIYFSVFNLIISSFLSLEIYSYLIYVSASVMLLIIILSGIQSSFEGNRFAIIFTIGWIAPLCLLLVWIFDLYSSIYAVIEDTSSLVLHALIHSIAMSVRITELRREQFLAKAQNEAKTRFLATASHDLRQPLHAMNLFTSALSTHIADNRGKEILQSLQDALSSMSHLFNSLMDVSRLDSGVVEKNLKEFKLADILNRLYDEFYSQASQKNIELRFVRSNAYIYSDPLLLERILRNIISNAIRYTEEGKILIGCRRHNETLRIQVCDTGAGISKADLKEIFKEYSRISSTASKSKEGIGLGLSIVKRISDLLEHPLHVDSSPGNGTIFSITVPLCFAPEEPASGEHTDTSITNNNKSLYIVIIDDDSTVLEAMQALLTSWHCDVLVAQTIKDALDLSQSTDKAPDLLLADGDLGNGETGIDAIKKMRELWDEELLAVIISGDTSRNMLKEAKKNQLSVLHKPVPLPQLRALLSFATNKMQAKISNQE